MLGEGLSDTTMTCDFQVHGNSENQRKSMFSVREIDPETACLYTSVA
jgi:hypothetical protein